MDGIQSLKRKWDLLGYKKQKNQLQNFFGFHMSEEEYLELGDSVKSVLGNNDTAKILENWSENLGCEDLAKARVFLDVFGLISFGHDAKINLFRPENQPLRQSVSNLKRLLEEHDGIKDYWLSKYDVYLTELDQESPAVSL